MDAAMPPIIDTAMERWGDASGFRQSGTRATRVVIVVASTGLNLSMAPRNAALSGASPAASRAAQASARIDGRDYVVPDDVKRLAVPVLSHRVITRGYFHGGQREAVESLIARLVDEIPVPG